MSNFSFLIFAVFDPSLLTLRINSGFFKYLLFIANFSTFIALRLGKASMNQQTEILLKSVQIFLRYHDF